MTYIRTKLRFALRRRTLAAIQGFRDKQSDVHLQGFTDIPFSFIPRPTINLHYSVSVMMPILGVINRYIISHDIMNERCCANDKFNQCTK